VDGRIIKIYLKYNMRMDTASFGSGYNLVAESLEHDNTFRLCDRKGTMYS